MSTLVRYRWNKIEAIYKESKWIMEEKEIVSYFKDKFEELFKSNHPQFFPVLDSLLIEKITREENSFLGKIPTEDEIRENVWILYPLKSPSPEDSSGVFSGHIG